MDVLPEAMQPGVLTNHLQGCIELQYQYAVVFIHQHLSIRQVKN